MRTADEVTAIVLNYRGWPYISEAVDALLRQTRRPDRIVVVDNCSGDGSAERVAEDHPAITLVRAARNGGYGMGMNIGYGASDAELALFLTHDCIAREDLVEVLVGRLRERSDVGAVGPLVGLRSDRNSMFSAGGRLAGGRIVQHNGFGQPLSEWLDRPALEVEWLDGCCFLARAEALGGSAKPFDEGYFLYFEEVELFTRMRKAGWTVECAPATVAWQEPGRLPAALLIRNRLRFCWRNQSRRTFGRALGHDLVALARNTAGARVPENRRAAKAYARGLAGFVGGSRGISVCRTP